MIDRTAKLRIWDDSPEASKLARSWKAHVGVNPGSAYVSFSKKWAHGEGEIAAYIRMGNTSSMEPVEWNARLTLDDERRGTAATLAEGYRAVMEAVAAIKAGEPV